MIGYFDCFAGVAGDMILGSMLDAGLSFSYLKNELKKVKIGKYRLVKRSERRGAIGGTNFLVEVDGHHHHHITHREIASLIKTSKLNKNVKDISLTIFETIAKAEGKVHKINPKDVAFHEVGAVDSMIDIIGAAIGFDKLKLNRIYASPLPMTRGWVQCQHGRIPIPAPATLEIVKGLPLVSSPVKAELVTPTGAAILKTVCDDFCSNPVRVIKKIGYGHGDRNFKEFPNSLRFVIGEGERLVAVEANIDDMNPQIYDYLIELLSENGAVDVSVRPILMKKRRPAAQIQVLCQENDLEKITKIIFKETTTIGVRHYIIDRDVLDREIVPLKTKYGMIRLKVSGKNGHILNISPEYEDCKKAAKRRKVSLKEVYASVYRSIH